MNWLTDIQIGTWIFALLWLSSMVLLFMRGAAETEIEAKDRADTAEKRLKKFKVEYDDFAWQICRLTDIIIEERRKVIEAKKSELDMRVARDYWVMEADKNKKSMLHWQKRYLEQARVNPINFRNKEAM